MASHYTFQIQEVVKSKVLLCSSHI